MFNIILHGKLYANVLNIGLKKILRFGPINGIKTNKRLVQQEACITIKKCYCTTGFRHKRFDKQRQKTN